MLFAYLEYTVQAEYEYIQPIAGIFSKINFFR